MYGRTVSDHLETFIPGLLKTWQTTRRSRRQHVFVTMHPERPCVVHLPLLNNTENEPTLEHAQLVFRSFAQLLSKLRIRSLAIYALALPGFHGPALIGFLEAALHGLDLTVHVFDSGVPPKVC